MSKLVSVDRIYEQFPMSLDWSKYVPIDLNGSLLYPMGPVSGTHLLWVMGKMGSKYKVL